MNDILLSDTLSIRPPYKNKILPVYSIAGFILPVIWNVFLNTADRFTIELTLYEYEQ